MKRLILYGCNFCLITVLSGCHHGEKQAATIYEKLENAGDMEQDFSDKQNA